MVAEEKVCCSLPNFGSGSREVAKRAEKMRGGHVDEKGQWYNIKSQCRERRRRMDEREGNGRGHTIKIAKDDIMPSCRSS